MMHKHKITPAPWTLFCNCTT